MVLASEKWCSSLFSTFPKLAGTEHLAICIFSRLITSLPVDRPIWSPDGTFLAGPFCHWGDKEQQNPEDHIQMQWWIILVCGWSFSVMLKVKQSYSIFQWRPSALSGCISLKARSFILMSVACSDVGLVFRTVYSPSFYFSGPRSMHGVPYKNWWDILGLFAILLTFTSTKNNTFL